MTIKLWCLENTHRHTYTGLAFSIETSQDLSIQQHLNVSCTLRNTADRAAKEINTAMSSLNMTVIKIKITLPKN